MHTNTPHMGNWSLRTPNGEYVTDAKEIFAFASSDSDSLRKFNVRLAGTIEVNDIHNEDPYEKITTSSILGVRSLDGGLLEVITDRYHEYILNWSGIDPGWKREIDQKNENRTIFRLFDPKTVNMSKKGRKTENIV